MLKCPYCGHDNEEGTLFCEQCKSDLAAMSAADIPLAAPATEPLDEVKAAMTAEQPALGAALAETTNHAPISDAAANPTVPASSEPTMPATQPAGTALPEGAKPRLVVLRGLRVNVEYPIFEGENFIGRTDDKPVDIDLEDQEPPDRIWSSRQHAIVHYFGGQVEIEDLNSSNGTFVNRTRVYPNQKRPLQPGDVLQIGTVQMRLKV